MLGNPDLGAIAQDLESDTRRLAALGVGERDVRNVDARFLRNDAAFLLRGLALMAAHDVNAAHDRAIRGAMNLDDLAAAALVAAGDHHHLVALPDFRGHHSTSGASEMIFMWFFARNSRGTGPKIRVPTGSI